MREYARKAIVESSGRSLVVKEHAIELAERQGNRAELERLRRSSDHYVVGDQQLLDDAVIYTPTPVEQGIPMRPSFTMSNGEEVRGVQSLMEDK